MSYQLESHHVKKKVSSRKGMPCLALLCPCIWSCTYYIKNRSLKMKLPAHFMKENASFLVLN